MLVQDVCAATLAADEMPRVLSRAVAARRRRHARARAADADAGRDCFAGCARSCAVAARVVQRRRRCAKSVGRRDRKHNDTIADADVDAGVASERRSCERPRTDNDNHDHNDNDDDKFERDNGDVWDEFIVECGASFAKEANADCGSDVGSAVGPRGAGCRHVAALDSVCLERRRRSANDNENAGRC